MYRQPANSKITTCQLNNLKEDNHYASNQLIRKVVPTKLKKYIYLRNEAIFMGRIVLLLCTDYLFSSENGQVPF